MPIIRAVTRSEFRQQIVRLEFKNQVASVVYLQNNRWRDAFGVSPLKGPMTFRQNIQSKSAFIAEVLEQTAVARGILINRTGPLTPAERDRVNAARWRLMNI